MHITLIGKSNIGKSHWSRRRLEKEMGYKRICCDDLIEQKLGSELIKLGYHGIHDVAVWMGQPYDTQYPETSRKYLDCEREVMLDVIEQMKTSEKPLVIDTTGSVIYLEPEITDQLKALSKVIYLEESEQFTAQLFERYLSYPKPVIWGDSFVPRAGEDPLEAVKRCFPELLKFRSARYLALSHLQIPYERHRAPGATWAKLIADAEQTRA